MSKTTPELNQPELSTLRDLIRRQAATFAELNTARTFRDIATVIAKHMLHPRQYVSVAVFNYDDAGEFIGYRVVATANRRESWDADMEIPITYDDLGETIHTLIEQKQPVILDVEALAESNDAFRAWVDNNPIKSMLAMPLMQSDAVIGHIAINSLDTMIEMSDASLALFTSLSHQINIITHANKLISESRDVHSRASDLIHTNRLISTADTTADMLAAALRILPNSVKTLGILIFDRLLKPDELPKTLRVSGLITRHDGIIPNILMDSFTPEQSDTLQAMHTTLRSDNPILEMEMKALKASGVANNLVDMLEKYEVGKVVNAGLRAGDLLRGILMYGLSADAEINYQQRDNFVILADQISIVLENRRLLENATENLEETQMLYDMNRELLSAETGLSVLKTLKTHLAQDATSLSMVNVTWSSDGHQVTSVMLQDVIDKEGERSPNLELLENNSPEMIEKYKEEWDAQGDDIDFIDDAVVIGETRPAVKKSIEAGIYASIVIPIREENRLIQQIFIAFGEKQDFPARVRQMYRAIKDQLTLSVQNRSLLSRLEVSLSETQILYNAIQALVQAEDSLNILRALRDTIATDANSLSLVRIEWDHGRDVITSFVMEAFMNESEEAQPGTQLINRMDAESKLTFEEMWMSPDLDIEFIPDYDALIETRPDLRISYNQGLRASILMPVKNDGYVVEFIAIAYSEPHYFSNRVKRLYNTLYSQLVIIAQNQLLVRDTRLSAARLGNQVRILRTLNTLATDLPSATNETDLAEMTCHALMRALTVDHVSVWLDNTGKTTTTVIGEAPEEIIGIGREIPLYTQIQELMMSSGDYLVDDVANDETVPPALKAYAQRNNIHTFAILPLIDSRIGYVGSIQLDVIKPENSLSTAELDIARTITNQTAVSLQNITLLKNAQNQAKQLQQIASFGQATQTTFNVEELLRITMRSINDIIACDSLALMIYNTKNGTLELNARSDGTTHTVTPVGGDLVALEDTTAGHVWKTRDPLQLDDMNERDLTFIHHADVQSVMAMPVYLRGTVQGVLEAGSTSTRAYSETDMLVFQQLASQISVALENAQAYTQNQRLAQSKAQVNEITNTLQRQTEIDRIMTVTARELGKALGAKRARIRLGTPEKHTE